MGPHNPRTQTQDGPREGKGTGSGKRSGRGGGGPVSRDVLVSKKISYVLRHGARKEGLVMDEGGWVGVGELLQWPKLQSLSLTFPELQSLVASNDKQRFELQALSSTSSNTDPAQYKIRASQGHSLEIASESLLTPVLAADEDCPNEVVHGTSEGVWPRIRESGGLKVMGRRHVHFAVGVPGAGLGVGEEVVGLEAGLGDEGGGTEVATGAAKAKGKVISGMRANANLLIWVDVKRSMEGGLKWWRSANGVVLTEGDEKGIVSLEWVRRVVKRDGTVVWEEEKA